MPDISRLTEFDRRCIIEYANAGMSMHGASVHLNVTYPAVRYHLLKSAALSGLDPRVFRELVHLMWLLTEDELMIGKGDASEGREE